MFWIFPWDGLTPNFGGVNIGFGDQKILSDLGMVVGISKEIPHNRWKIPLLKRLNSLDFNLWLAASESSAGVFLSYPVP